MRPRFSAVLEAFLQEDQPSDAPVAVLERVDLLEADVQVEQGRAGNVSLFAVDLDVAGRQPPLFRGVRDGHVVHDEPPRRNLMQSETKSISGIFASVFPG